MTSRSYMLKSLGASCCGATSPLAPRRTDTTPLHGLVYRGTTPRHTACLLSPRSTPFLNVSASMTIEGEEGGVVNAVMYENSCKSNDSDADVFVSVPGDSRPSAWGVRRVTEATEVETRFSERCASGPPGVSAAPFGID
jgi:hypothetical protein